MDGIQSHIEDLGGKRRIWDDPISVNLLKRQQTFSAASPDSDISHILTQQESAPISRRTGLQWSICSCSWRNMHTLACWGQLKSSAGASHPPPCAEKQIRSLLLGSCPPEPSDGRQELWKNTNLVKNHSEWMTTGPRCVSTAWKITFLNGCCRVFASPTSCRVSHW